MKNIKKAYIIVGVVIVGIAGVFAATISKSNKVQEAAKTERTTTEEAEPVIIDGKKIAINSIGFGDSIEDYELSDLQKEAELIIYGETVDYKCYLSDPGFIRTVEQIEVKECISGQASPGDIIEVRRAGGYVLVKDYLDSFKEED